MITEALDRLISRTVRNPDPRVSQGVIGTLKESSALAELCQLRTLMSEQLKDPNLSASEKAKMEKAMPAVNLLVSFFGSNSHEERQEILELLEEIDGNEPVLKEKRTLDQWDKELKSGRAYNSASKDAENARRSFLKHPGLLNSVRIWNRVFQAVRRQSDRVRHFRDAISQQ